MRVLPGKKHTEMGLPSLLFAEFHPAEFFFFDHSPDFSELPGSREEGFMVKLSRLEELSQFAFPAFQRGNLIFEGLQFPLFPEGEFIAVGLSGGLSVGEGSAFLVGGAMADASSRELRYWV